MKNPYLQALKQGFAETTVYSVDFLLGVLQSFALVGAFVFVWVFIIPPTDSIPLYDRAAYFILVNGMALVIGGANYRYARDIGELIKEGSLTHFLLRPINPVIMIYVRHLGGRMTNIIMGSFFMIAGILMKPPESVVDVILFILMTLAAIVVTASINLIAGSMYFWTTEAGGIRNAFSHVTRILNGQMVPMSLFRDVIGPFWGNLASALPFAAMSYTPAIMINRMAEVGNIEIYVYASFFWAIVMPFMAYKLWLFGLKNYEGTGA